MSKLRFIESAEFCLANPLFCPCPTCNNKVSHYEQFINDCHPFVFSVPELEKSMSSLDSVIPQEVEACHDIFDLPFPVISIEVLNGYITIPHPDDLEKVWIYLIIVKETNPREYNFLIFAETIVDGKRKKKVFDVSDERGVVSSSTEGFGYINALLIHHLKKLSREKIGVEARGAKLKIGTGKNKRFWRPKNITYVSPKNYISKFDTLPNHRNITWSHRWEVRGHWRAISGVGKDRDGNYCVVGNTWVSVHSKGPEHMPLIKKTRLVTEEV